MKDRTRTYRYSGGVKCRRNKRHWPANNGRSCQQLNRRQAPASPAPQTYRRRMTIVVIVIDNTRRRNCKSTWTQLLTVVRRHLSPEIYLLTNNSETVPKHVESTRKTLFLHNRIRYVESRNAQHVPPKSRCRLNVVLVRSNGVKEDD